METVRLQKRYEGAGIDAVFVRGSPTSREMSYSCVGGRSR